MSPDLSELRDWRKRDAHRKRRIIFNNDGDDLWKADGTRDGILAARTTPLVGTHVDAIWSWGASGTKLFFGEGPFARLYCVEDGPYYRRAREPYEKLMAECGRDHMEIMIDFCRAHDIEIFYSARINDLHESYFDGRMQRIKLAHPEWCLGTKEQGRKYGYPDPRSSWSAMNFEVPEIRRMTVEALQEVCRTYDIDGIELDFWRHLVNFPEMTTGGPVTPEHVALMNELVRDLRAMTEAEGLRRGRPIVVAARCVEDLDVSLNSGLDVRTWLEQDLVDILTFVAATEHTPSIRPITEFADGLGVPVYPIINAYDAAVEKEGDDRRGNLPVWRADALNKFDQGAAGLQTFNLFDPDLPQWRELGDPDLLRTLDRTYVWHYLPSQRHGRDTFGALRVTRHRHAVEVTASGCEPMPIHIGEDLSSAPGDPKLTLRVHAAETMNPNDLQIRLNDRHIGVNPAPDDPSWLRADDLDPGMFRKRENLVTAQIREGSATIDQVRLEVRPTHA
ncbi:MAG: hypothetical protein CMJ18_17745 [Phycisphaeraceae bacterium]|nr:hypothetical protein [Phycisphaeraceae bacterium]